MNRVSDNCPACNKINNETHLTASKLLYEKHDSNFYRIHQFNCIKCGCGWLKRDFENVFQSK